ncbi:MAG: hypothetical protein WKF92_02045 [Pyrinomonadaceae bacterium]
MKFHARFSNPAFLLKLTAAVFTMAFMTNIVAAQNGMLKGQELRAESSVESADDTGRSFPELYKKIVPDSKHFNSEPLNSKQIFHRSDLDTINTRRFFPSVKRTYDYKPDEVIAHPLEEKDDEALPQFDDSFRWGSAIRQSLLFLSIQHGYALTQPKTREALKGKFLKDYANSVKSLKGWDDGGRFFTNYIAHPLQGSFMGFIQIQNDPKGMKQRFGPSADYWRSRMKAMAWSAAWSTQFEIGPLSQASIGNVGLHGKQTWIDLVVTPTAGTAFLITEDAMDRFVIERIERMSDNYYVMVFARMLLNPTRTMANIIRFKLPWYRERKRLH